MLGKLLELGHSCKTAQLAAGEESCMHKSRDLRMRNIQQANAFS
jgi:hypothetical protein